MIKRILIAGLFACASLFSGTAPAGELSMGAFGLNKQNPFGKSAAIASKKQLDVSLIPEAPTIEAGRPFDLIMRFDHAPDSYTYWTNPGGPGQSAKITWKLPPGFMIGSAAWPAPVKSESSGIVSYVYKGKTLALFTVTPPASLRPGDPIEISAELDIQVCTPRTCTPKKYVVAANARAADQTGTITPLLERARNSLPSPVEGWEMTMEKDKGNLALVMTPGPFANTDPGNVYFFDSSDTPPFVDSQKTQLLEKDGNSLRLILPVKDGAHDIQALRGVVSADHGWLADNRQLTNFSLDLPIDISLQEQAFMNGPPKTAHDAAVLLFFAFLGGLLLNVMPCVFPVISLKVMGFAKQAHKDRRAIFLHGLAYAAGVLLCFWALAILVVSLGRGWGAQLQSALFVYALCHLFVIMALNMAGVFEVGSNASAVGQSLSGRVGVKRSFFTGLLATVTSTPCSAPFLGSALAYALSLPAPLALGVFTLMGFGFALPYLALSLFPGWLKRLPKPGQWMETFRQAMSFPLFATAGYMLWTLEGMVDDWRLLMTLFGLVTAAFACWLYGKGQRATHARHKHRGHIYAGLAVLFLAAGVWIGWPHDERGLEWREWSPELVRQLQQSGKPVYVDFTARWCATCQVNKRVYSDPEVADLIASKDVVLLKADWTQYDERITDTLKNEFNKAAVPVTALYVPGENEARLLPELLTTANVAEELRELP